MNYRLLGKSGLRVSDFCLGTMTFGNDWGWGAAKDEAQRMYSAFREAGGNFVDTANYYTKGTSESLLGEFVKGHTAQAWFWQRSIAAPLRARIQTRRAINART
jgi:aryl-alcohol dehydrogenase-like predicted oxidoreductase